MVGDWRSFLEPLKPGQYRLRFRERYNYRATGGHEQIDAEIEMSEEKAAALWTLIEAWRKPPKA